MINLRVQNTKELIADLRKAGAEIKEDTRKVLKEMADVVADDARGRVPVDTGSLKNSIKPSVSKRQLEASVSAGGNVGGTDTYYAVFVEFGTHKMPARPFLYPSGRAHEQETEERLTAVMYEALRKGVEG
jgi:HK97 gp10 family phage protein